jgi:hypothetical protein
VKTIAEQFAEHCENYEGDVICPHCGQEIGQYYEWGVAANLIEHDKCPICDCNAFGEDCDGTYEWCEHCKYPCENRIELQKRWEYESHVESEIAFMRGK